MIRIQMLPANRIDQCIGVFPYHVVKDDGKGGFLPEPDLCFPDLCKNFIRHEYGRFVVVH